MLMYYSLIVFILILSNSQFVVILAGWNLSEIGFSQDILIWRFTIWRNKAYLAIPRWDNNSKVPFTLLEVPWPELSNYPLQLGVPILTGAIPYPNGKYNQEGNCRYFQSVTGLDSDTKGRLWVLDAPTQDDNQCSPKIVLFDLRRGEKVTETNLHGVSSRNLKCLVTDPDPSQIGGQAYISDPGDESIIVYSLARRTWWRLKMSRESANVPKIFTTDLAISRKNSLIYLTGYQSDDLFAVDLESIRNNDQSILSLNKNDSNFRISVSWIGSKLGSSSGLICDFRGGLNYFMITEMASVRWDTKYKLEAENHAILSQSEAVPSVTDFALDSQKNVWALVNEMNPLLKTNIENNNNQRIKDGESLKRRTIRIWKFNPFIL